jgi:hypothetical protein
LSAPLELAPTLRGYVSLAALRVEHRKKHDAKTLIIAPGRAHDVTLKLAHSVKSLINPAFLMKFSEEIGTRLIVFGTIWKA